MAYSIATVLRSMPLDEMLDAMQTAEATVPIFNPSLYLEKGDAFHEDKQLVEILVAARKRVSRLDWREAAR